MELCVVNQDLRPDAVVLRVQGDVDSSTVGTLTAALSDGLKMAQEHPARLLVVDLAAVRYFGSAGLNAVLNCHNMGSAAGTAVRLVANHPEVVRPIEVTDLDSILELYSELADALNAGHPQHQP